MATHEIVDYMNGKGRGYETNSYQMGSLLASIKEIYCVYRSTGSSGQQTLWDLKPEERMKLIENLEKQPKELKKQIRTLRRAIDKSDTLLAQADERILKLEDKLRNVKMTPKQRLKVTMEVTKRMNGLLVILDEPHSTEEILRNYPLSRGTLLKDLCHLKNRGLVKREASLGKSGRGNRLIWSLTN